MLLAVVLRISPPSARGGPCVRLSRRRPLSLEPGSAIGVLRLVNASPNYGGPMNLATVCYVLVSIAAVIYILDFLGVV